MSRPPKVLKTRTGAANASPVIHAGRYGLAATPVGAHVFYTAESDAIVRADPNHGRLLRSRLNLNRESPYAILHLSLGYRTLGRPPIRVCATLRAALGCHRLRLFPFGLPQCASVAGRWGPIRCRHGSPFDRLGRESLRHEKNTQTGRLSQGGVKLMALDGRQFLMYTSKGHFGD